MFLQTMLAALALGVALGLLWALIADIRKVRAHNEQAARLQRAYRPLPPE